MDLGHIITKKFAVPLINKACKVMDYIDKNKDNNVVTSKLADIFLPSTKSEEELMSPKNLGKSLLKGTIRGILGGTVFNRD